MTKAILSEELKVRLLPEWKAQLEKLAVREHLDVSDITRRAIDQFLTRQKRTKAAQ